MMPHFATTHMFCASWDDQRTLISTDTPTDSKVFLYSL